MCIQDWRLGRLIRAQSRAIVLGLGATETFPANKQRVGVTVGIPVANNSSVNFGQLSVDGVLLVHFRNSNNLFEMTLATHGDLPMRPFTLTAFGIAVTFGLVEYFLPEEFLAAGLEEFKSEKKL